MDACGQKRKTRVCQNRIYTLNMTVYLVISLPKNRIYIVTVYIYGTYIYIYIYIYILYITIIIYMVLATPTQDPTSGPATLLIPSIVNSSFLW